MNNDNNTDLPLDTVAAIDLGSNSFHMIVAQPEDGHLRMLDRIREPVRLAAGLDEKNRLAPDAQQRALDCLRIFGQRLQHLPQGSVRAVGTNTLRKARGSGDFLAAASEALGHPIEVISGVEEARIIYLGVSHSLPLIEQNRLVVDIGGGSTEVIIGRHFEPLRVESLYMGCVSASRAYFPDGVISREGMERALLAARQELRGIKHAYRRLGWREAVGASGTIKAVGAVVTAMGWSDGDISHEALDRLAEALVAAGHVDKLQLEGLKDERRPVLPGGVAVLKAVFDELRIDMMRVSDWALREGLVYDLIGRIRHEDVRERTISALMQRYHVDGPQAERVTRTALTLLGQVAGEWELGESCDNMLGWAAELHEIGLAIAHSQYHKHGAYLLGNSDMPGFSRDEQQLLALLVRGHRRKFPLSEFKGLGGGQRKRVQRLCVLLRLAVLFHRSRSEHGAPELQLRADGSTLHLRFPPGWLEAHPLTQADLESENAFLRNAKFHLTFE